MITTIYVTKRNWKNCFIVGLNILANLKCVANLCDEQTARTYDVYAANILAIL